MKNPPEPNGQNLKSARRKLLREKRQGKRHWQFFFASNCQSIHFKSNPKAAWKMVFKLMEGFQAHHKTYLLKNFKSKSGTEAKNLKKMSKS